MAKKKHSFEPASPAMVELLEVARKYPTTPVESKNSALELKVSMGDIRTMAMVELRRNIIAARDTINGVITEKQREVAAKSRKLVELGNKVIDGYEVNNAAKLMLSALNGYRKATGIQKDAADVYQMKAFANGTSLYGKAADGVNDPDKRPTIDADDRKIKGEIKFFNLSKYSGCIDELDAPIEIPFTPEMSALVDEIHAVQAEITEQSVELSKVNRQLAELPHQGDIIQSMLTRAHLSGELNETSDILKVLEHGCSLMQLPEPHTSRKQLSHAKTTDPHT